MCVCACVKECKSSSNRFIYSRVHTTPHPHTPHTQTPHTPTPHLGRRELFVVFDLHLLCPWKAELPIEIAAKIEIRVDKVWTLLFGLVVVDWVQIFTRHDAVDMLSTNFSLRLWPEKRPVVRGMPHRLKIFTESRHGVSRFVFGGCQFGSKTSRNKKN